MSQLRCPKCKAMHFSVQATDLQRATGEVECSNCGHIRKLFSPAKPPTSRLVTDGRSAAKVTLALPVENNSTGAIGQGEAHQLATAPRNNLRPSLGELAPCLQCGFAPVRVDAPCNGAVQFCFMCPNVECQSDRICPENYRWCLSKKQAEIVWNRDNAK